MLRSVNDVYKGGGARVYEWTITPPPPPSHVYAKASSVSDCIRVLRMGRWTPRKCAYRTTSVWRFIVGIDKHPSCRFPRHDPLLCSRANERVSQNIIDSFFRFECWRRFHNHVQCGDCGADWRINLYWPLCTFLSNHLTLSILAINFKAFSLSTIFICFLESILLNCTCKLTVDGDIGHLKRIEALSLYMEKCDSYVNWASLDRHFDSVCFWSGAT